ncbi:MAG: hypothetical protein SPL86_05010 [Succiniclasticum sp.]|uniref:hypothetical protein n=1 Tax=Succiniclasticum sp. TaxID=2775030 RepID=UPI002A91CA92|nr:hypothetical protein [Succiniclasticum sp.]MDY6290829.1 hypothetical protein [Succiniclasticum sp.]
MSKYKRGGWTGGIDVSNCNPVPYEKQLELSPEEIHYHTSVLMDKYDKAVLDFEQKTKLTKFDFGIMLVAAMVQILRWSLLSNDKLRLDKASDSDKYIDKARNVIKKNVHNPDIQELLLSVVEHYVPYDVVQRSEKFLMTHPGESIGLAGSNHRFKTLGHDPIAGLVVGTANIATSTLTVNNWQRLFPCYYIENKKIDDDSNLAAIINSIQKVMADDPKMMGAYFLRQIIHCGTDAFTRQGLPIPVINTISPETSKFLIGNNIDMYAVTRSAALAMLVNKIVEMCHRLFFNPATDIKDLYDVRTRKVLTYSNTLSSVINIGYVAGTKNFKNLDVGGILVTLWRILNDAKTIRKIKYEFIERTISNDLKKEEDEVNQRLANWGFYI